MDQILSARQQNSLCEVLAGEQVLLSLDSGLSAPREQSPRPFAHPMRTLAGILASDFAPPDHAWHHGLSFTCAHLGHGARGEGANFWGGPTFERGRGYVALDNHGRQECEAPRVQLFNRENPPRAHIAQSLHWIVDGEILLEETRALEIVLLSRARGWRLAWNCELRNASGHALRWGSPTTQGRDNAGYGGLFWRGPRGLAQSRVAFCSAETERASWLGSDSEMMGRLMQAGESLAFYGRAPENNFVLAAEPMRAQRDGQDLSWKPRWFARVSVPMVCWAFCFDEVRVQEPGESWSLSHRLALLDVPSRDEVNGEFLRAIWTV
jgi:hypothetical protein